MLFVDARLPFWGCVFECYLPFENRHVAVKGPMLPTFRRSIVVRLPADAVDALVRPH